MQVTKLMNTAYFTQGAKPVATTSSFLVSSSKYLNNAQLRDWMATHFLRRNGPDWPTAADNHLGLTQAMDELRDDTRLNFLIEREKRINPKFKAWIEERYLSSMTKEDFAKYGPDTLGGRYHKYLVDFGLDLNLGSDLQKPRSELEFFFSRVVQIHDFEHIAVGAQFNSLGEILPYFVRLANFHQHISAELAQYFCEPYIFGGTRLEMRACLHYPTAWLTVVDMMRRGFSIGLASECMVMLRYEDVLHLPVPEARIALGVRNAEDIDATAEDEVYTERRQPTEEELMQIGRPDLARIRL